MARSSKPAPRSNSKRNLLARFARWLHSVPLLLHQNSRMVPTAHLLSPSLHPHSHRGHQSTPAPATRDPVARFPKPAQRMARQDVGAGDLGGLEQRVEFLDDLR